MNQHVCFSLDSAKVFHDCIVEDKGSVTVHAARCGAVSGAKASNFYHSLSIPYINIFLYMRPCKKCYGKYSDVRYTVSAKLKSWSHGSLMTLKNGNLHYEDYPQNIGSYDPKYQEIIKDYGLIDWQDNEAREEVIIRHTRENPPEKGLTKPDGWLLPNGDFYPCESWEHDSMADYIYRYTEGTLLDGGIQHIEKLGWLRIYDDHIGYRDTSPTQKQIDTLYELYLLSTNERFKKYLKWDFESWGVEIK